MRANRLGLVIFWSHQKPIRRENLRRSGILLFPDCPRFCQLMKTRNRRYPRSSGFLFSRRVPGFCDGRRSFPINENSKLHRRGRRRWISLITSPLVCWAPVHLSQINIASLENMGQTSGDYPIYRKNLGWSAKSKIPDRLGFSRHMKTRLNLSLCQNYNSVTNRG